MSPEAAPGTVEVHSRPEPPGWIEGSPLLTQAYALAESAHRSQQRASDGRPFLDHVTEVGTLLHEAGFDVELVATGLLHDAVERGTLSEDALRTEMPESIGELVLTLSEDPTIESFSERKAALRAQVAVGGGRALTVFAADKLSDIIGLRRGLETFGVAVEETNRHQRQQHGRALSRVRRVDRVGRSGLRLRIGVARRARPSRRRHHPGGRTRRKALSRSPAVASR